MTYQTPDVHPFTFLPFLLLTVAGVVALLWSAFASAERQRQLPYVALLGLAATAIALVVAGLAPNHSSFSGMLAVDNAATGFAVVFLIATALTVLLASEHLAAAAEEHREVYGLLLLSCLGMMFMAAGGNLIMIFVGLETMSISLYVMAAMSGKRDEKSNEAALKYLLLGAFATGFLVYGMALLYGATGSLTLSEIAAGLDKGTANLGYFVVGLGLLTIGLGFKVAAVPFHMWAPDVYEGSPTVITAFMAVGPKIAGFAALYRVFHVAALPAQTSWVPVMAALAVVTILVGNIAALAQTNIKRLLAYSSIAHAGYLLLGVMAASGEGLVALLYYSGAYAFLSLAAFAVVLLVYGESNEDLGIERLRGLGQRSPLATWSFCVALVGMMGLPPLSGFWGKYLLFLAAVQQHHVIVAALGVLGSAISVFYYFRLIRLMVLERADADATPLVIGCHTRWALLASLAGTVLLSWPLALPLTGLLRLCLGG